MQGPTKLLENEDNWVTDMGAWFPAERVVFRGKDLFRELGDLPWMGLLLYGITGRVPDEKQIRLFDAMWVLCTSYPDPRLWNNRVAALAGTARSTALLALGAANAVSEASLYGRRPGIRAIDFLLRAKQQLDQGVDLKRVVALELEKHKRIYGYGRPVTDQDERIVPLLTFAATLGFSDGVYVGLAFAVEEILLARPKPLHMNIAIVLAALAADQGLTPHEYYRFMALSFSAGMTACHVDAMQKPEGTLFPLSCKRLAYCGAPRRVWESV
ncbi:citrate/2-methylcitrate synthase [Methylogaea oryzae]|uniref:citrate synthase (unknown stereospecificity) n=1 Tax=Methylogaea oryzae TaxID=1295382 RepID=A0A8D4VSU3_9GAMM|nr:citrate/2-methylcitrate synthase [Methylogaea oryzae]BBL72617.1 hypothetical protein MoryE10_32230 [Methylogaea oryzae]